MHFADIPAGSVFECEGFHFLKICWDIPIPTGIRKEIFAVQYEAIKNSSAYDYMKNTPYFITAESMENKECTVIEEKTTALENERLIPIEKPYFVYFPSECCTYKVSKEAIHLLSFLGETQDVRYQIINLDEAEEF